MATDKPQSAKLMYRRADDVLPDHLQKLRVPGTLSRLNEIGRDLEKQGGLVLQNDELQQARTDLELLLEQYTELYDSSPVGYLTLNRNGLILEVNSAGTRLFGVDRSRLMNQHLHRFMNAESWPEYTNFLERIYNNHSQETFEFELQRPDDKIVVHIEAREYKEGDACIATLIDITAEEQVKWLRKEELKYRVIFDSMTHGIVLCGRDGKVVSANQAAKTILGLTSNQMELSPLLKIFSNPIHENGSAFSDKALPFMEAANSDEAAQTVTMGYIPKHSTYYTWIVISAMTVSMPEEEDVQFLISFDDITSQKNLTLYNTLTIREKEVFQMYVKGYSRKDISKNLGITPKTVDKHRENLMEKLKMYLPNELVDFSKQFDPGKW
jgi:PAS domain S-box-containing protein